MPLCLTEPCADSPCRTSAAERLHDARATSTQARRLALMERFPRVTMSDAPRSALFCQNAAHGDGNTAEGGIPGKSVDRLLVREIVEARSGVRASDRERRAVASVSPSVRQADDAADDIVGERDRHLDRADPGLDRARPPPTIPWTLASSGCM